MNYHNRRVNQSELPIMQSNIKSKTNYFKQDFVVRSCTCTGPSDLRHDYKPSDRVSYWHVQLHRQRTTCHKNNLYAIIPEEIVHQSVQCSSGHTCRKSKGVKHFYNRNDFVASPPAITLLLFIAFIFVY